MIRVPRSQHRALVALFRNSDAIRWDHFRHTSKVPSPTLSKPKISKYISVTWSACASRGRVAEIELQCVVITRRVHGRLGHDQEKAAGEMPTGFFDLPREIRDIIYDYSIIDMRNHPAREDAARGSFSTVCQHDRFAANVARARPPYFALYDTSCFEIDRWLHTVTLVSKQFAAELRALFWQRTIFRIESQPADFGHPLLSCYREFFEGLGPEAKHLRRVVFDKFPRHEKLPCEEDAEWELEHLRGLVHPAINIFLTLDEGIIGYRDFHCTVSQNTDKAFIAHDMHTTGSLVAFEEYIERI